LQNPAIVHSRRVTVARARPAASRSRPEALDVGAADAEQLLLVTRAPGRELAQIQGIGVAGQAAVPGQEPG